MATSGELELITGFSGTEHISSADDGAGYASIVGKGEYVSAETGEGFRAELVDSNTVRIYDGDAWFGGRHIRLAKGTYVDVKIDSGTQGRQRNDLIVIRYTKDASTEKEKAEFVAIKGTPTTGTPADPSYKAGSPLDGDLTCDFRLYRIHLNALTVDAPVKLFDDITPIISSQNLLQNVVGIWSGSMIRTVKTGGYVELWSETQWKAAFGDSDQTTSVIFVQNGDPSTFWHGYSTTFVDSAGLVGMYTDNERGVGQNIRINWTVIGIRA